MKSRSGSMLVVLMVAIGVMGGSVRSAEKAPPVLEELKTVDQLKEQFNSDKGKKRLLLLLSPT